jgi:hypothetical protein
MALRHYWYWTVGLGWSALISLGAPAIAATNTDPLSVFTPIKGGVRISNRSASPVRIVILRRQTTKVSKQPHPVHWDFAPREGRLKGLLLALPSETVALDRGDILTAFAQDGSARYWGPYIIGESPQPTWNNNTAEWEVTLAE